MKLTLSNGEEWGTEIGIR